MMFLKCMMWLTVTLVPLTAMAQSSIQISLNSNTPLEQEGKKQLERILDTYTLDKWIFTDRVRIESYATPHSHPVLTLNTRYTDNNDEGQLATFLHEQIHWFADEDSLTTEKVINRFRTMYPSVPVGDGQGARDEYSTYLHLLVCWLEFDGLRELIGEEQARAILAEKSYYRWIYDKVLKETDRIGDVVKEFGMVIE